MAEIDRFIGSNGSHEAPQAGEINSIAIPLFSTEKLQEIVKPNGNGYEATHMFTGVGSEAVRISRRKEKQRQLGVQIARRRLIVQRR